MDRPTVPTIPVGQLRQALAGLADDDEISFSGLTYLRVKARGPHLSQVEFSEQVYLDAQGRVVVQNLE